MQVNGRLHKRGVGVGVVNRNTRELNIGLTTVDLKKARQKEAGDYDVSSLSGSSTSPKIGFTLLLLY